MCNLQIDAKLRAGRPIFTFNWIDLIRQSRCLFSLYDHGGPRPSSGLTFISFVNYEIPEKPLTETNNLKLLVLTSSCPPYECTYRPLSNSSWVSGRLLGDQK